MTKNDVIRSIADKLGVTQAQTKRTVQKILDTIIETVVEEGRMEFRNFGVFEVKYRNARKAHNPRTGEEIAVKEKYVVTFKASKALGRKVSVLLDKEKK
jgi:nucleoid DNA-binding protein